MNKNNWLRLNIQHFAKQTFNPDNVLMQDYKSGQIPAEQGTLILKDTVQGSAIMQLAKYEEMTKMEKQFTFLADGVSAYWVDEAERIQTSKPSWSTATMRAKKMGVIIPVTKEFLQFSVSDFFNQMRPQIAEAFYTKFDQATIFGNGNPFGDAHSIWANIQAAGNTLALGAGDEDLYDQLNSLVGMVEDEDGTPNGFTTLRSNNKLFRGVRDKNGIPLYTNANGGTPSMLNGQPIGYVNRKSWDRTKAEIITGDWDFARYGIVNNIQFEILTEATLTTVVDQDGAPLSLAERDMVALKATFMPAFMVLKEGNFAALTPTTTP